MDKADKEGSEGGGPGSGTDRKRVDAMADEDKPTSSRDVEVTVVNEREDTHKAGQADADKEGINDEHENIKSCFPSAVDNDESKKDGDTSKAVTWAEDVEVYDMQAGTPITVSLDTPVHLIEPEEDGAWKIGGNLVESVTDGPKKDEDGFVSADFAPPTNEEARCEDPLSVEKQCPTRPTILNLKTDTALGEEGVAVIPSTESGRSNNDSVPSGDLEKDESVDLEQKFIVSAVDESELQVEPEENGQIPSLGVKKDGNESGELSTAREHSASGHSSQSNDSYYHDTIGPLENPAFLKTLQISVSQPLDDEEQFGGLQSNLDLSSLAVGQNDPNLDGGWAWVVLAAAFINLIILAASCLLTGVMLPSYVEVLKADMAQVSWIGSVYIAIMCIEGPLVGTVTKKIGARATICTAGTIMFFGFIGASFSETVPHLILTHSLMAGIGSGLAVNPSFVIVGQYFNRLRGLACGLMATGGGAGVLAGGALISHLLKNFDLHGAYLIWAAVCFNVTAMGMLMRPSPEEKLRQAGQEFMIEAQSRFNMSSQHELVSGHNSIMSGLNSVYSGTDQHSVHSGVDRLSQGRRSGTLQRQPSKLSSGDADVPLLKTILHREMSRSSHSMSTNKSHHRSQNQVSSASMQKVHSPFGSNNFGPTSPVGTPTMTNSLTIGHVSRNTLSNHNVASTNSLANSHLLSTSTIGAQTSPGLIPPSSPTSTRGPTRSSFTRPRLLSSVSQPTSHYTSLSLISQRLSFKDGMGNHRDLDNESMTSTLLNTLKPIDTLTPRYALGSTSISALMGSIASFPTSLAIINDDLSRVDRIAPSRENRKTVRDYLIDILDALRIIFNNKPFVIFLGTAFLWAFGEAPVMMYLASYAISRGTDPMQASALYTAMGVGSIAGRFLTGLISTEKTIGPMLLHIGCLGLAGFLIILSPLITSTLVEQMLFSALLGVYTGSLVPLMSLLTIELLGISELSIGFGFLYMAQGFGYLIGPPLAGVLFNSWGFSYSFVFSGVTLMSGSLLGLLIPMVIDVDDEDNNSVEELERVLQKISDSDSETDNDEDDNEEECEKDEDKKTKDDVVTVIGSVTENHSGQSDDVFITIGRTLDEGEDKLETIKEIV